MGSFADTCDRARVTRAQGRAAREKAQQLQLTALVLCELAARAMERARALQRRVQPQQTA